MLRLNYQYLLSLHLLKNELGDEICCQFAANFLNLSDKHLIDKKMHLILTNLFCFLKGLNPITHFCFLCQQTKICFDRDILTDWIFFLLNHDSPSDVHFRTIVLINDPFSGQVSVL